MKQDSSHTDKWDILLDLLENPTAYSETQKNEILGDEETLEMYRQIVNVHQALDSQKKDEEIHLPSMDEEWEKLKEKKLGNIGTNPNEKIPAKTVTLWNPMRKNSGNSGSSGCIRLHFRCHTFGIPFVPSFFIP